MYWLILIGGVLLDRISKLLVMNNMELFEHITVIPHVLNFVYVTNDGAAFSMFSGQRWGLILFTFVALALLYFLWRFAQKESELFRIAVVMIASGAIGNFVDRLVYTEVIDFLQFGFWTSFPVFNVADILIVLGAGFIILDLFLNNKKEEANEHK